ncbi:unnamed protein product [Linum trigynum]|uniref:Uncharacterized protein n=1 Tax=Linum trigynum TaxID=586398 RepID=A0AAV2FEW0_9ROSI
MILTMNFLGILGRPLQAWQMPIPNRPQLPLAVTNFHQRTRRLVLLPKLPIRPSIHLAAPNQPHSPPRHRSLAAAFAFAFGRSTWVYMTRSLLLYRIRH